MLQTTSMLAGLLLAGKRIGGQSGATVTRGPRSPRSVRLYVMDCGTIHVADPARFQLMKDEVAALDLAVACYLIVHPKGTLM